MNPLLTDIGRPNNAPRCAAASESEKNQPCAEKPAWATLAPASDASQTLTDYYEGDEQCRWDREDGSHDVEH